jgi:hypothetical protein
MFSERRELNSMQMRAILAAQEEMAKGIREQEIGALIDNR